MTNFDRYSRIFSWLMIAIALVWLCLVLIPQFVDRCSRNEASWLNRTQAVEQR